MHLAWTNLSVDEGGVGDMNIPLVSDHTKEIAADYGVLIVDKKDDLYGAALRGLFIIDPEFTVRLDLYLPPQFNFRYS